MDIYSGEIKLFANKVSCIVTVHAITNPSPGKSSAFIDEIIDESTGKKVDDKNKETLKECYRQIFKLLLGVEIEMYKHIEKGKTLTTPAEYLAHLAGFEATDQFSIIPGQTLTDDEIKIITASKENSKKLFASTTLLELEEFIREWNEKIAKNAVESEFQTLLFEHKNLIPLLFGYSGEVKKELVLPEGEENRADLAGPDWIIELKRPTTDLFTTQNGRNNIAGVSSKFSSAEIQLDLYLKKKNRENHLLNSFTNGTLIIGHSDQLSDNEKKMTLNLIRDKSSSNILLFDDVTKRAERLIVELQK